MESAPPIDDLVETIRAIIGSEATMSREDIISLLRQAEMDPNKAVDLYFQTQVNGKIITQTPPLVPPSPVTITPPNESSKGVGLSHKANELRELLGDEVTKEEVMHLLQRSDGDLEKAVEFYFAQSLQPTGEDEEEEDVLFPPAKELEIHPNPLEPLTPHSDSVPSSISSPPSSAELESLLAPDTYEVVMTDQQFRWQVCKVFNRAVVQWVDPNGPAAQVGIQKSDVLLSFRDVVINELNCSQIINELSKENVVVPSSMRLRRAPDTNSISSKSPPNTAIASDSTPVDEDVVMTDPNKEIEPKYGLQVLFHAVLIMMEAIGDNRVELKTLVDLLLVSDFNLNVAVDHLLNQHRAVCDLRHIVGYNLDTKNPFDCMQMEPYIATIPIGPLGLTVENVLERTIIVDIKAGGAAERANIKRSSWLIALNGTFITHLTHKETLQVIESASRPMELMMIHVPTDDYHRLRSQLQTNSRQPRTERPIPEQDRMSFRVFQLKIHQAVLVMPKLVVVALFQHLTSESNTPLNDKQGPTYLLEDVLPLTRDEIDIALIQETQHMKEEQTGEMCEERRFLLNLFAAIHDHEDKGESIVIRTIQFIGWLGTSYALLQQHIGIDTDVSSRRYIILLSTLTHVLESLSIIENHATWDVMVDAFRLILQAMTDSDIDMMVVPMFARLSVSPSPTARIVPIALLSLVYTRVSTDVQIQLRGMVDRMCNDDNPLVRRAIASIIGEFVHAAGASVAQWGVHLLVKTTADTHDIVRIFAVKSCIRLAKDLHELLPPTTTLRRLLYCQIVPMVNTFISDSTWQVRFEAAKSLPAFCLAFGSEYADVIVDHFVGMINDPTVEIRKTCAENAFEMGEALLQLAIRRRTLSNASVTDSVAVEDSGSTSPVEAVASVLENIALQSDHTTNEEVDKFLVAARLKIVRSVLPPTYHLATDLSVSVRLALAKSVGKCVQLISVNNYNEMVPIFTQLLDEKQEANVRASLLEEMARYCDPTSQVISSLLIPAVTVLRASTQWRVRVKFLHCVAAYATRSGQSGIPSDFADTILDMMTDTIHEVRTTACSTLPPVGRSMGDEWLVSHALPRISKCLEGTFHERITGLVAIESLSPQLKEMEKLHEVIDMVIKECSSSTPNIRFCALRSLASIVLFLDDPPTTASTIEFVHALTDASHENDVDVRNAAQDTLLRLQQSRSVVE